MSMVELVRTARALGHVLAIVEMRPGRWQVGCSCGYESTFRRTRELAGEAGAHHLRKSVRRARSNGVSAAG